MGTSAGQDAARSSAVRAALVPGTVLAYGVGAALQWAHAGPAGAGSTSLGVIAHWLRDSSLAWPMAVLAAALGLAASRRLLDWARLEAKFPTAALARALPTAVLYAVAVVPAGFVHALLFPEPTAGHAAGGAAHAAGVAHAAGSVSGGTGAPLGSTTAEIALGNLGVALLAGIPLLLALQAVAAASAAARAARRARSTRPARRSRPRRLALAAGAGLSVLATLLPGPTAGLPTAAAQSASAATPATCNAATASRTYDVAAINVHVPYNRWGQGNPDGQVYVLQGDKSAVKNWDKPLGTTSDNRRLRPRPLVLRANEGECVQVHFTNELNDVQGEGLPSEPRASMSVRGIPYDVQTSGGSHAGYNDDSTVSNDPGTNRTTYYWSAPTQEGVHFFNDTATPAGSEADGGSLGNGLYGAFVVEPAGSTWTDPVSGKRLYTETGDRSGELYIDAVITPPSGKSFRESVQLAQDELPTTSAFAFNYGSEPGGAREAGNKCPDCVGEETSLSSWAYGDPGMVKLASGLGPWKPKTAAGEENCGLETPGFNTDSCFTSNVTHAYVHDPIKFRYGMAGVYETHVFHMHAHTWLAEENDVGTAGSVPTKPTQTATPESNTIDSQTIGPMEMFTADLLYGAGGKSGTVGDSMFHCHLYPHFADGFWSLFRVHDVREDGSGATPDGIKVPALKPLPSGTQPPTPTPDNPGFPRFIPGQFGWRAPQPPMGISDRGVPATRYVAGKALDESSAAVALETGVANRLSGGRSKPGAPFSDACPTGAREVTYNVSAIQVPIEYNERGDHDTQARILVLDKDVDDVLSGRKKAEPLFARVNAGDCVNWNLTNRLPNWFGNDAFLQLTQTNMFGQHIHLVRFDVLASDGSSNGWNYQQAAFSRAQASFNEQAAADPAKCTTAACRLALPADYDPRTTSAGLEPGQTIHERWYADYELRTVFTHDHHFAAIDQNRGQYGALVVEPKGMDFRDPRAGANAWRQPINDPARGPVCGTKCEGNAVGTVMDVIGPGADDDFRDFGLAIADYVSLTRKGGNPKLASDVINPPPDGPEAFPNEDPGVRAINYRNAPLELRRTKNGQAVDPAYVFSSYVFGDPRTPVLQTYHGDNVRMRLIQGSHEEQHVVNVHGMKWKSEPNDPGSPWVNAQTVGISEAFNFEVPKLNCPAGQDCRGDFLYGSGSIDDMATGMWGLLRVNGGTVPGLPALPDNAQTRTGTVPQKSSTAVAPLARQTAGNPCPTGAPARNYSVVAMQARIDYNRYGDHDPYGLVYALASDEAAIKAGRNPQPLVLRANEGDCINVTLTNKLTTAFQKHRGEGDAPVVAESTAPRTPGLRVSMHAGLLTYDVRGSDGAAIGYNRDQTVAPGKSMAYKWYAEDVTPGEMGAVNLTDFGDVRGHRHHGLFAGLVVEPKGSTWHDPVTGRPGHTGPSADIRVKGSKDFRENVVFFQDGLNIRRADGSIIPDVIEHDISDGGERAFNYRNAPFRHRLGYEPMHTEVPGGAEMAAVYDSHRHGDPDTPIQRSYTGDELVVRVLQGADKSRQHGYQLDGHSFKPQPDDPQGRRVGTLSGINVGSAVNAEVGAAGLAGDYLYGNPNALAFRSGGMWGFQRVYPKPVAAGELLPTAVPAADDPRAGGHPVLPLELDQVRALVFNDLDRDGVKDAAEPWVPGATVAKTVSGTVAASGVSGPDGSAYLSVRAGTHALKVTPPAGFVVGKAPTSVKTAGNNAVATIRVALRAG